LPHQPRTYGFLIGSITARLVRFPVQALAQLRQFAGGGDVPVVGIVLRVRVVKKADGVEQRVA
jgi:hypothetical protein